LCTAEEVTLGATSDDMAVKLFTRRISLSPELSVAAAAEEASDDFRLRLFDLDERRRLDDDSSVDGFPAFPDSLRLLPEGPRSRLLDRDERRRLDDDSSVDELPAFPDSLRLLPDGRSRLLDLDERRRLDDDSSVEGLPVFPDSLRLVEGRRLVDDSVSPGSAAFAAFPDNLRLLAGGVGSAAAPSETPLRLID
jgi:hypothetical protein